LVSERNRDGSPVINRFAKIFRRGSLALVPNRDPPSSMEEHVQMKVDKLRHFSCFVSAWNVGRAIVKLPGLSQNYFFG
jgi:hypothetical protein